MPLIKTDTPGLYRDTETNAIIDKNYDKLDMYLVQREQDKKLNSLYQEHEYIKNELSEIKQLLKVIATKEKWNAETKQRIVLATRR